MQYTSIPYVTKPVSRLVLGAAGARFTNGGDVSDLMETALSCGINAVDTARVYGESEAAIGRWLQTSGRRDEIVLISKGCHPNLAFLPRVNEQAAADDLERSLELLGTDHIDVYLLHCVMQGDWKNKVLPNKAVESLLKAKEDGRVGAIGFSFHDTTDFFKEVVDYAPWDICQLQLNYLDREFQGGLSAAAYAASKGMGVIAMEPLRGGHLVNVPSRVADVFNEADSNRTPIEWAFDFLWNRPEISLLLSGMTYKEQIDENIVYAQRSSVGMLSDDELKVYDRAIEAFNSYDTIPCTGCNYCTGCPQGVTIPYNFQTYNQYVLSGNMDRARWEWETTIPLNGARADACIACGTCEERCPQHIEISKELEKVAALFA
jgi:predicted aldo/keto reductase-like oxidoreductase